MKTDKGKGAKTAVQTFLTASLSAFLLFGIFSQAAYALNGADVAIYNDSIAPSGYSGVWQNGVTAIKNMVANAGLTYEEITYSDLNYSDQNFSSLYRIILIPGGFAKWYNYWISRAGKDRIRNFINNGGGYFGICAGAFFAVDKTIWEGTSYDDGAGYNAYGEWTGYDLDLFQGSGTGPMNAIADWNGEGYNMTAINFQSDNTVLRGYKQVPYTEDILYFGGPYFSPDAGSGVEVLATYNYNGQPAVVAFNYGSGRVVLSGPHPEIEEDSDRDGVTIDREDSMSDNGSDWDLVKHILTWLRNSPVSHALTAPSVTVVSQGGQLGPFYASVINNTGSSYSFYLSPYIKTPDSNWHQMFSNPVTLAAGETRYANDGNDIYLDIPSVARAGTYEFCVKAYDTGNKFIEKDCFDFEVRAAGLSEDK